jgi:hypothetical protein
LFIGNPYISWGKQWLPVKIFPSTNQVVNLFGHIVDARWKEKGGEGMGMATKPEARTKMSGPKIGSMLVFF